MTPTGPGEATPLIVTDELVVSAVAHLLTIDTGTALLMQRLWRDRTTLLDATELIATWDLRHPNALVAATAIDITRAALDAIGLAVPVE